MKPATPEHLDDPEQPRLTDGGYHWPDEWSAAPAAELRNADVERLRRHIQHHLRHTLAIYQPIATSRHYYLALVHTLREYLTEGWVQTQKRYYDADVKRVSCTRTRTPGRARPS